MKKGPPSQYDPEKIKGKVYHGITIICHDHDKVTVPKKHPNQHVTTHYVRCICPACGKEFVTEYSNVKNGYTKSCGCVRAEQLRILGKANKTHGKRYTRLYRVWMGMRMRCYNPNNKSYEDYGGRGIYICDEWMKQGPDNPGFMNFYNWAYANGYYDQPKGTSQKKILTIDRIDVNGPYAPWNCQWVTRTYQGIHRTDNVYIQDVTGEMITMGQFRRKYNKGDHYVINRRHRGWSDAAIIYAVTHPEMGIHRPQNQWVSEDDIVYVNKDGKQVLIPSMKLQIQWYKQKMKQDG